KDYEGSVHQAAPLKTLQQAITGSIVFSNMTGFNS
ncbi:hypothetical protein Tsp_13849, partial [Trichinella spiralis]